MDIYQFQHRLLAWYNENKRDLPWRKGRDPYHIWVSEIMLQQTKVDTVLPYFERFTELFPTIDHLASASEEKVLKAWEGLGYYSRARNLHKGVKEVQSKYQGKVPDSKENILDISGVGPYTAGAILSIAYNKPLPAVDGNVMRVISRIYNLFDDISKGKTRSKIENIVEQLIPEEIPGDFNQALMELGALICTPKSPHCLLCPVLELCEGRKEGNEEKLPIKAKKKSPKVIYRISLVIQTEDKVVLVKRPSEGLLANMWELPSIEHTSPLFKEEWEENIYNHFRLIPQLQEVWMNVQHTFSHIHWNLQIYELNQYEGKLPDYFTWINKDQLSELAFPKAYQEAIKRIK